MPSRFYAQQVTLRYRNEDYVAVESRRIERVVGVDQVVAAVQDPPPVRVIPAFSTDAEAAIRLETGERALATRVRRVTERLRVIIDSDVST